MKASCQTCLYMATHDNCDGCLHSPEDYAEYRETGTMPPFRFANYHEGNWMARVIHAEAEGARNIVIGGQGEAEVNTKWTPAQTSKSLHRVSEQCGYCTGNLRHAADGVELLRIATHEGAFELEWKNGQLENIWRLKTDGNGNYTRGAAGWSRSSIDIFPVSEAYPERAAS